MDRTRAEDPIRIHLARIGAAGEGSTIETIERLAAIDRWSGHQLVGPDEADVVLFTQCHLLGPDWRNRAIRSSEAFRAARSTSYVMDERDRPWCAQPGLYTSMPMRHLRREFQVPWCYHTIARPQDVLGAGAPEDPDLLFSFMGSPTHPCREAIVRLEHPRAVVEQVDGYLFHDDRAPDHLVRRQRFAETLLRSRFVLCPRGHGTSSIRFYETLAAGRVPVVMSDDWAPPFDLEVDAFAIRWPERSVSGLIEYLEAREDEAAEMGRAAADAFDRWFADEALFGRLGDALSRLHAEGAAARFPRAGIPDTGLAKRLVKARLVAARDVVATRRRAA